MENKTTTSKTIIINYGLILGGISIFISLIQYAVGDHLEQKKIYGIISFLLIIVAIILAVKNFKKNNEGYLSFGEAVKIGVGLCVVSSIIIITYNLIFMNFIEPDFMNQLLAKQEEMMFNNGMNEEQIKAAMAMAQKFKGPFISSAFGIIMSAFVGFVISAITGAILKNSREE